MSSPFSPADVAICAAIQRKHASTYALATRFFPLKQREATQVFYAFVRTADDLVDEPINPDPEIVRRTFDTWAQQWRATVAGERSDDPVIRASAQLFREERLPLADAEAFLKAMRRDIDCSRYATYDELMSEYVYGSAAVIGQVMARLCCCHDEKALSAARRLGEAMQLTNFLRDVRADLLQRGRLYLAQEDLARFGVTEAEIRAGLVTPAFKALIREYVRRARTLYASADLGIPCLPGFAQPAVRLSRVLYARILDRIEAQDYDIFRRRASVHPAEKLYEAGRVLLFS